MLQVGWQFEKVVSLLRQQSQSKVNVSLTLLRGIVPQANGDSSNGSITSLEISLLQPSLIDFLSRKMPVIGKKSSPGLHRASSSPNLQRENAANPLARIRNLSQRKGSLPTESLQPSTVISAPSFPFYSGPKFAPGRALIMDDISHERNASAPSHLMDNDRSREDLPANGLSLPAGRLENSSNGCETDPLPRKGSSTVDDQVTPRRHDVANRSRPNSLHLPHKQAGKRSSEGFVLEGVGVLNPAEAGAMKKLSTERLDAIKASSDTNLVGLHHRGSVARSSRRRSGHKKTSTGSLSVASSVVTASTDVHVGCAQWIML